MGEVSGLTSVLILGAAFDGLQWLVVDSFFTLGSALMLVFCGVGTLEGELIIRVGVSEPAKAGTVDNCTLSGNVLLACGVTGGLRVDAGVLLATLPLASGEAMVAPPDTVLPLAILRLVPVLVVPAESWSIDTSTSPTFIVILVFLHAKLPQPLLLPWLRMTLSSA